MRACVCVCVKWICDCQRRAFEKKRKEQEIENDNEMDRDRMNDLELGSDTKCILGMWQKERKGKVRDRNSNSIKEK